MSDPFKNKMCRTPRDLPDYSPGDFIEEEKKRRKDNLQKTLEAVETGLYLETIEEFGKSVMLSMKKKYGTIGVNLLLDGVKKGIELVKADIATFTQELTKKLFKTRLYINCSCGEFFESEIEGSGIVECPECGAKFERRYDQVEDIYEIIDL